MSPLLLLLACTTSQDRFAHFSGPVAATTLAEGVGPFDVATGFVANSRSGTVVPLDLKGVRFLSDDPSASFLRASAIPFGDERILADVAVYAEPTAVDVWTIDNASGLLLRAPYVISVDEDGPREVEPDDSGVLFVDADGSGDAPTITDLELRPGLTTTEDWSIVYDGTRWWAEGSASGKQDREPIAGERYWSDNREVEFDLQGEATLGDRFEFHTETGVRGFDLGARAMALLADDGALYVSLADGRIVVMDAATAAVRDTIVLPTGSQPTRLVLDDAGVLYAADAALPQVHLVSGADGARQVTTLVTAAPLIDVAWAGGLGQDGTPFRHLFVLPLGLGRVDVYDTENARWVDPNPVTPEVEGIPLGAPLTALAASAGPTQLQIPTEFGAWPEVPTILVSSGAGVVYVLDASTGCYAATDEGPKGPNRYTDDLDSVLQYEDLGTPSSESIVFDVDTGAYVVASACAGVLQSETWFVTYDGALLSWEVEGSKSGVQGRRAYDDARYVSDDGAISFLIVSGALPPSTGDSYTFTTDANVLTYSSTTTADGQEPIAWAYPGRAVGYALEGGPTGGGWDEYDVKQYALLPVLNADITAQLLLDEGVSVAFWL